MTEAFTRFLIEQASECQTLYILGDLFEVWIGDDDSAPLAQHVIQQLRALTEKGTELNIMHGNRDFALGRRFAQETGCSLMQDLEVINLYGEKVLLLHGDTLCTDDLDYQKTRRLIRNPVLLSFMKRLPLKMRQQLAIRARTKSLASTNMKTDAIMDVSQTSVVSTLINQGVTTMIHGHTHRPKDHSVALMVADVKQTGRRIVLGDWSDKGWFIEASSAGLSLESFQI